MKKDKVQHAVEWIAVYRDAVRNQRQRSQFNLCRVNGRDMPAIRKAIMLFDEILSDGQLDLVPADLRKIRLQAMSILCSRPLNSFKDLTVAELRAFLNCAIVDGGRWSVSFAAALLIIMTDATIPFVMMTKPVPDLEFVEFNPEMPAIAALAV